MLLQTNWSAEINCTWCCHWVSHPWTLPHKGDWCWGCTRMVCPLSGTGACLRLLLRKVGVSVHRQFTGLLLLIHVSASCIHSAGPAPSWAHQKICHDRHSSQTAHALLTASPFSLIASRIYTRTGMVTPSSIPTKLNCSASCCSQKSQQLSMPHCTRQTTSDRTLTLTPHTHFPALPAISTGPCTAY